MGNSRTANIHPIPKHLEGSKVIGKLKEIHLDGTVTIQYICRKRFSPKKEATFELAGLDFYTGTDALLRYSKLIQAEIHEGDPYMLYLGPPSNTRKNDGTSLYETRTLRLFQENGFGLVDVNRRLQMGINNMLHDELEQCKNPVGDEWVEAGILKAWGTGDIMMGGLWRFFKRIISFVDEAKLEARQVPEETMETLLARGENVLTRMVFVVKCPRSDIYYRSLIRSMDRKKNMVEVHHVDTDTIQKIDIQGIYEARKVDLNFANFPHLAFKCHLTGLVSVDDRELLETCSGKSLRIHIQGKGDQKRANNKKPKNNNGKIPSVNLYMEHDDDKGQFYWINEHLVNAGLAVPKVMKEYRSLYAPGWGKCEA